MNHRSEAAETMHDSTNSTQEEIGGSEAEALERVRAMTRSAGSSFYWAMRILPEARRDAMFAVYAFCRDVDDITDGDAETDEKIVQLAAWRREIDRIFTGAPQTMLARALVAPAKTYGLRRDDFLAIIDGMEMDVRGTVGAPSLAQLQLYCDRVAGAVGLLSVRIFGAAGDWVPEFALTLGTALQLTNILRDLSEDAAMGRLYLPRELLDGAGIAGNDPAEVLAHPALATVCAAVAEMAQEKFEHAQSLLAGGDSKPLKPAVVMMMHYWRILERLRKRGWHHLDIPVRIPIWEKLWLAFRYGVL